MLRKKSKNQLYSHTFPHYDQAALQKAICSKILNKAATHKSDYCRKSEDTHKQAMKKEILLSAPKHFPDCFIKATNCSMPRTFCIPMVEHVNIEMLSKALEKISLTTNRLSTTNTWRTDTPMWSVAASILPFRRQCQAQKCSYP